MSRCANHILEVALFVVGSIDKNLIEYLVEAWYDMQCASKHTMISLVDNPYILPFLQLNGADVRVRTQQDMLQLRLLLVDLLDCRHCHSDNIRKQKREVIANKRFAK